MDAFLREAEAFRSERVFEDIVAISRFHRIQGSEDIVKAAEYVLSRLEEEGIEAELIRDGYDGKRLHLTLRSPIAWELIEGYVEYGEKKLTTKDSPLLVMAHSPPGEAEGELLPILREEDWEKAEGKVVLVGEKWREAYKRANEAGAKAFIAYRKGTGEAFPYVGLFLTREDLKWAKIPAVAVPEKVAEDLITKAKKGGVQVKVRVETEVRDKATLPIVYARIGEPPYLLFSAHICHPKPGANDNASGSAMLIEIARLLKNVKSRVGFAFLWVPEYHGTQAFISRAELEEIYANINLDMVAGSDDRAGSTVMLVRNPLSRFSLVSGILEHFLAKVNVEGKSFSGNPLPRFRLKAYPYEMGSDHDVFNFFGVPGTMPITWPDRFYHSSADSPEKLSLEVMTVIGRAALATALAVARAGKGELERFARGYAMKVLGEISMERKLEEAGRLVMNGLARDSRLLGLEIGNTFEPEPWLEWREKGIISARRVKEIDEKKGKVLEELFEDRTFTVHLHELLMLGEMLPKEKAFRALEEEYGKVDREKLERALRILEEVGFVREI
ncbi:DUF4910 domain-containing protein [Pyrococcus yayanosii]|uniref:Peptidase, M28 family n=1 Tax=Pyrococcus yayanosii (strain CH1 / JCM 16557) TaxID=529709 RepID=F8AGH3_PYRYC|nr:DUF4910 domain-containing protein [Pyrococcus yayanosii]AEH25174.1 peptidase, M28 family [Pyrococcus yayanosii CH1]